MPTLEGKVTLGALVNELAPDGSVMDLVNRLTQVNQIIQVIPYFEGNIIGGNISAEVTSEGEPSLRAINEGVIPTINATRQIEDKACHLEDFSEVDEELIRIAGAGGPKYRANQDKAKFSAFSKRVASLMFYGNAATNQREYDGFSTRFDELPTDVTDQTDKDYTVIDAGGSGSDNHSIWLFGFSEQTVFGMYPKNTMAGFELNDLGLKLITEANNRKIMKWTTQMIWKSGIVVKDRRYAVRIANIDNSLLTADVTTGADLANLMIEAMHVIGSLDGVDLQFAMNRTMLKWLDLQTKTNGNTRLEYTKDIHGRKIDHFRGIPINRVDQLLGTEEALT